MRPCQTSSMILLEAVRRVYLPGTVTLAMFGAKMLVVLHSGKLETLMTNNVLSVRSLTAATAILTVLALPVTANAQIEDDPVSEAVDGAVKSAEAMAEQEAQQVEAITNESGVEVATDSAEAAETASSETEEVLSPLDDFSDIEAERLAEEAAAKAAAEGTSNAATPPNDGSGEVAELDEETRATLASMGEVITALDSDASRNGNNWELMIEDTSLLVVTDVSAKRMRIITPVAQASLLTQEALTRLLQANFDTALDARYAIARGIVWSTFIHPLEDLTTREFASGLLQAKTLSDTFGTTFSSGILNYGGGDSGAIIDDQVKAFAVIA